MKLAKLAQELKISTESFIKFIQDFDLELAECLTTNFEVKKSFEKFARENAAFLLKYEIDLAKKKSVEDIAENINQPTNKIAEIIEKEKPKLYDNGIYKSSVSSFGIDNKLGGNYQFVYEYFGKKSSLIQRDFIGYRDLFFHISRTLEPFINESALTDWGIKKTAGIILYGPPGSGKVFWANKIADITGYRFETIKQYYYGTSFVDGSKTSFNDFLLAILKENKVLLFMDDFDTVMRQRNDQSSVESCDEETKEIILHHIGNFEKECLLMVGSALSIADMDREILAPGRFDLMIPVFPPNAQERLEMILHNMQNDLSKDSLLMKILIKNKANQLPFWKDISSKMKVFSNTMIIDFTQSLKRRIRNAYLKDSSEKINIDEKLLDASLRDASAKLTGKYLDQVSQFIMDVSFNNYDDFPRRIDALKKELESYKKIEAPRPAIGFTHNEDKI